MNETINYFKNPQQLVKITELLIHNEITMNK